MGEARKSEDKPGVDFRKLNQRQHYKMPKAVDAGDVLEVLGAITTAPVRAAIAAGQRGEGVKGAAKSGWEQLKSAYTKQSGEKVLSTTPSFGEIDTESRVKRGTPREVAQIGEGIRDFIAEGVAGSIGPAELGGVLQAGVKLGQASVRQGAKGLKAAKGVLRDAKALVKEGGLGAPLGARHAPMLGGYPGSQQGARKAIEKAGGTLGNTKKSVAAVERRARQTARKAKASQMPSQMSEHRLKEAIQEIKSELIVASDRQKTSLEFAQSILEDELKSRQVAQVAKSAKAELPGEVASVEDVQRALARGKAKGMEKELKRSLPSEVKKDAKGSPWEVEDGEVGASQKVSELELEDYKRQLAQGDVEIGGSTGEPVFDGKNIDELAGEVKFYDLAEDADVVPAVNRHRLETSAGGAPKEPYLGALQRETPGGAKKAKRYVKNEARKVNRDYVSEADRDVPKKLLEAYRNPKSKEEYQGALARIKEIKRVRRPGLKKIGTGRTVNDDVTIIDGRKYVDRDAGAGEQYFTDGEGTFSIGEHPKYDEANNILPGYKLDSEGKVTAGKASRVQRSQKKELPAGVFGPEELREFQGPNQKPRSVAVRTYRGKNGKQIPYRNLFKEGSEQGGSKGYGADHEVKVRRGKDAGEDTLFDVKSQNDLPRYDPLTLQADSADATKGRRNSEGIWLRGAERGGERQAVLKGRGFTEEGAKGGKQVERELKARSMGEMGIGDFIDRGGRVEKSLAGQKRVLRDQASGIQDHMKDPTLSDADYKSLKNDLKGTQEAIVELEKQEAALVAAGKDSLRTETQLNVGALERGNAKRGNKPPEVLERGRAPRKNQPVVFADEEGANLTSGLRDEVRAVVAEHGTLDDLDRIDSDYLTDEMLTRLTDDPGWREDLAKSLSDVGKRPQDSKARMTDRQGVILRDEGGFSSDVLNRLSSEDAFNQISILDGKRRIRAKSGLSTEEVKPASEAQIGVLRRAGLSEDDIAKFGKDKKKISNLISDIKDYGEANVKEFLTTMTLDDFKKLAQKTQAKEGAATEVRATIGKPREAVAAPAAESSSSGGGPSAAIQTWLREFGVPEKDIMSLNTNTGRNLAMDLKAKRSKSEWKEWFAQSGNDLAALRKLRDGGSATSIADVAVAQADVKAAPKKKAVPKKKSAAKKKAPKKITSTEDVQKSKDELIAEAEAAQIADKKKYGVDHGF